MAAILRRAAPKHDGVEVVFWGADQGLVAVRDNSGVTGPPDKTKEDADGNLDLLGIEEQFARSMSLAEAMQPDNLLCYEMNG